MTLDFNLDCEAVADILLDRVGSPQPRLVRDITVTFLHLVLVERHTQPDPAANLFPSQAPCPVEVGVFNGEARLVNSWINRRPRIQLMPAAELLAWADVLEKNPGGLDSSRQLVRTAAHMFWHTLAWDIRHLSDSPEHQITAVGLILPPHIAKAGHWTTTYALRRGGAP